MDRTSESLLVIQQRLREQTRFLVISITHFSLCPLPPLPVCHRSTDAATTKRNLTAALCSLTNMKQSRNR